MLSIIVATDTNGGIGKGNKLLFHIKEDMKRFKELTTGHTIIMGRKTYESLPNGGLPNRHNIILTRDDNFFIDYNICKEIITVVSDINTFIDMYKDSEKEVFVIGGGEIYKQLLPYCNKIYLTKVVGEYEADAFFNFNANEWEVTYWSLKSDSEYKYEFLDLIRKELN
jgi:dihydrofolate reductase